MNTLFEKVYHQNNLTKMETKQMAQQIFTGQLTDAEIAGLLIGLKIKGETPEEMAGFAEVLREMAVPIEVELENTICNCGTGGDQSNSFNISTTSAFVLAAAGLKVAKTGNRSISSKSGSFDVCEALGIDFLLPPAALAYLLEEVNLAFIFAPHVHPNMKYIMPTRNALHTPTIMNLIGPLTNPVALEFQLMGTYRRDLLVETAQTIQQLGRKRAVVVSGANSMDEASLAGTTTYVLLENNQVTQTAFEPEEVGLQRYPQAAILGGNPERNAEILKEVLQGTPGAYFETVLLNAGLGLFTGGKAKTVQGGINLAKEIIQSGAAFDKLQELVKKQKEVSIR